MQNKTIITISGTIATALLAAGCSSIIPTGDKSDTKISTTGNTVVTTNDQGTVKIGDSVPVPSDFPKDVYIIDGTVKAAVNNQAQNGYMLTIQTTVPKAEAKAKYIDEIKKAGWTTNMTTEQDKTFWTSATKDKRALVVMINEEDGKTNVVLTVGEDK